MKRPHWKPEVKRWWCGLVHRHKPEGRMVIGVRVIDYSVLKDGSLSVQNQITDEVAYCQRCNLTKRVTMKNGRAIYE